MDETKPRHNRGPLPGIDETLAALQPWMRGFCRKEYGSHVHSDDLLDFEQEGCMAIVNWITNSQTGFDKFRSVEEYYFYAKAISRNAIRDYDLRYFSRFNISLFKLRRVLKQMAASDEYVNNPHRQRLGDYMHRLGTEFADRVHGEAGGSREAARTQNRLNLLSQMSDPGLTDERRRQILREVIREFTREHGIHSPFPKLVLVSVNGKPVPSGGRTPVPSLTRRPKVCSNRLCARPLEAETLVVSTPGFGYCSADCLKAWPPVINRVQREFDCPIEVVLGISMKLFRSRRKSAEVIGIGMNTMCKLVARFAQQLQELGEGEHGDPDTDP